MLQRLPVDTINTALDYTSESARQATRRSRGEGVTFRSELNNLYGAMNSAGTWRVVYLHRRRGLVVGHAQIIRR